MDTIHMTVDQAAWHDIKMQAKRDREWEEFKRNEVLYVVYSKTHEIQSGALNLYKADYSESVLSTGVLDKKDLETFLTKNPDAKCVATCRGARYGYAILSTDPQLLPKL